VIFNDYKKRTHDKEETFNKYWFGSWSIALAPSFAFNQQKEGSRNSIMDTERHFT
jgi:hypothetical protein